MPPLGQCQLQLAILDSRRRLARLIIWWPLQALLALRATLSVVQTDEAQRYSAAEAAGTRLAGAIAEGRQQRDLAAAAADSADKDLLLKLLPRRNDVVGARERLAARLASTYSSTRKDSYAVALVTRNSNVLLFHGSSRPLLY